jgi:hypothetical protein
MIVDRQFPEYLSCEQIDQMTVVIIDDQLYLYLL